MDRISAPSEIAAERHAHESATPYSPEFYKHQQDGSLRSAHRVLPHVLDLVSPRSIADVGCGVGTWLAAATTLGVSDVLGIDGDYVDRSLLRIPPVRFRAVDLTRRFTVGREFDLVISLEVGEHLPESSAEGFVESLTRLAPVVLFSAAIPKQSGENHVNEQWQTWWVERFNARSFVAVDCIRPRIWDDPAVEWWYAQNTFLMVREDRLRASEKLREALRTSSSPHAIVHPRAFLERLAGTERLRPRGVREWLAAGPGMIGVSAGRALRRIAGKREP
jgi:SAM-dependent methyltransferase